MVALVAWVWLPLFRSLWASQAQTPAKTCDFLNELCTVDGCVDNPNCTPPEEGLSGASMIRTYVARQYKGDYVEKELYVVYEYQIDSNCGNVLYTTRKEHILVYDSKKGTQRTGCSPRMYVDEKITTFRDKQDGLWKFTIPNRVIDEDLKRFGAEPKILKIPLVAFDVDKFKEKVWVEATHGKMDCIP